MVQNKTLIIWHRRIGLVLIAIIFILATTGLLINHTSDLDLSDIQLNNAMLLEWYGLQNDQHPLTGFQVLPDSWLAVSENNRLFLNQQAITDCPAPLSGAVVLNDLLLALCKGQLLLISNQGLLIETINSTLGLPANSTQLAVLENQLIIKTQAGAMAFDINSLSSKPIEIKNITWPSAETLPKEIGNVLGTDKSGISLETLLLDIHSGRILGRFGVIIMDIATLFLLVLAFSGIWVWLRRKGLPI